MHLLPLAPGSLDPPPAALDVAQTPADIVVLSFSDGDLTALSTVASVDQRNLAPLASLEGGVVAMDEKPSLRLTGLKGLQHPFSIDLYVEAVASKARFVLVRILGGLDYWRYGLEELGAAARRHGFHLAAVPGCEQLDPRLDALSTLPTEDLRRLWRYFREGGPENLRQAMRFMAARIGSDVDWAEPEILPAGAVCPPLCRLARTARPENAPHALLTFYRSALLAGDTAPVEALAEALQARGARVTAFSVTSLKDEAAADMLAALIVADPPDVILNTTAFSARRSGGGESGGTVLDAAEAPVLQVIQSGSGREAWMGSERGLRATDLAMNVVLPEVDGRILAGVVSFKEAGAPDVAHEFSPVLHRPDPDRIAHAADLALAWARLRRTPRAERRLALVLSDYPGKAGRGGYAVGLDAPASLVGIAAALAEAGYAIGPAPEAAALMTALTEGKGEPVLSLAAYAQAFAALPEAFRDAVGQRWGEPAADADAEEGAFHFRIARHGRLVTAVQPDRGHVGDRRAAFHDTAQPPRHGYIAFYFWLREIERIHAMIHLGTHGTLEWLPGKAVALSGRCAPEAVLGPVPLVYPFIVSDPAKPRRPSGASRPSRSGT